MTLDPATLPRLMADMTPSPLRRRRPTDLSPLPPVAVSTKAEVHKAVQRARHAQAAWAREPFEARVRALKAACRNMLRDRQTLLARVEDEMGKSEADGLFTEALGPLETLQTWIQIVQPHVRPRSIHLNPLAFPRKEAQTRLVPRGVVGVIAPWNFPVAGLYRSVFPALLLGNGVVVKPSEYTPSSTEWFVKQLAAQLPPDLASVVQGDGAVGEQLIDGGVDAVNFTGSAQTGRKVRVRCAELDVPCSAEQGGNDVAIVLSDCDLERTAAGLTQWALQNAGQACGAVEVVAVEPGVADALVDRLADGFRRLRTGPGPADEVDVSVMAHPRQLAVVQEHVDDALARGASLRAGGHRAGDGLGFLPTLLDRCTPEMRVVQEETFGPVLAVVRVSNAYDGVRLVNEGRFGLTASVWSRDVDRAVRLGNQLDVGVVTVNNHALTGALPELPWAGTRASGSGIANSTWALTTFARPRAELVDRNPQPEPFWLPVGPTLLDLGHRLADAQTGRWMRAASAPILIRRRIAEIRAFFSRMDS